MTIDKVYIAKGKAEGKIEGKIEAVQGLLSNKGLKLTIKDIAVSLGLTVEFVQKVKEQLEGNSPKLELV